MSGRGFLGRASRDSERNTQQLMMSKLFPRKTRDESGNKTTRTKKSPRCHSRDGLRRRGGVPHRERFWVYGFIKTRLLPTQNSSPRPVLSLATVTTQKNADNCVCLKYVHIKFSHYLRISHCCFVYLYLGIEGLY
jgi:hypothetical protein